MRSNQYHSIRPGEARRQFIKKSSLAAATVAGAGLLPLRLSAAETKSSVAIVVDGADAIANQPPPKWAVLQLRAALISRGAAADIYSRLDEAPPSSICVLAASRDSQDARQLLDAAKISLPDVPEALALAHGRIAKRNV